MGNTLSASNPTEILPVEAYLSDLGDNVESLGSTRFMKVARGRNTDTSSVNVFKVFLIQDDTVALDPYRNEILRIRDALVKAPNCSTVRKIYQKPRRAGAAVSEYAVLVRPYQKYTLSDRLSTRPFVNYHERLWYIYQLFKALAQCQAANVCHGDLKSQNIVVSSSNWLQITDFAPFKPTFLPHDNPSSFTFFFDTSRRQSCHLAPERFLSSSDYDEMVRTKGDAWLFGSLCSSMDMFSAGCVVYEMLCEGHAPFSYGELCDYRAMKPSDAASHLEKLLADIPSQFRPLLKMLLNREPAIRMTAQQVLDGVALHFPAALERFFSYLNAFRPREVSASSSMEDFDPAHSAICLEPDDVIAKLKRDEASIWERLEESDETRPLAVLFVSLVTANLRALRSAQTKVDAMDLLVRLASLCDATVSTERVLPYLVFLLSDQHSAVRASAVHSIVALTSPLEPTSVEDSLVFVDYLLPEFVSLVEKHQTHRCPTHVIMALASNLGTIAQTAHRFLVVGRSLRNGVDDECSAAENQTELQQWEDDSTSLAKAIADLFVLLCGGGNGVRHCLIRPQSLEPLYGFFSKMGNSDILLHHMITFLNTKSDWQLRAAFFDALPICMQKKTVDVRPLLHQGLHDFEELVVVRVMNCISVMVAAELLDRRAKLELLHDTVPFLAHPNEWIRVSVVHLLVLLDSRWSLADIHCRLLPVVKPYLKDKGLFRFNHKVVVLNSLKEPIPRVLWDRLLSKMNVEQMRTLIICIGRSVKQNVGGSPAASEMDWFSKFSKVFETDRPDLELLWKIGRFDQHLLKMAEFRQSAGMESEMTLFRGLVDLSANVLSVKRNQHSYNKNSEPLPLDVRGMRMNNEWNEMFSTSTSTPEELPQFVGNRNMRTSVCSSQLRDLLSHKEELYRKGRGAPGKIRDVVPTQAKIGGTLITNLHEHTDKITQLALHPDKQRFASASLDGSVRLWTVRTSVGECYGAVRSDASFSAHEKNPALVSASWTCNGQFLALAAADGHLVWVDVTAGSDQRIVSKVRLPSDEGAPEEIQSDDRLVFVRSHHSVVYCLDPRVGRSNGPLRYHEVWRRDVSKSYGLVSSFCIDPHRSNWMTLGCTNRQIMLWDLRYQQEVLTWNVGHIPLKLWSNPCSPNYAPEIFAASQGRGAVSIYDLSRGAYRTRVLWPSLAPPLEFRQTGNGDTDVRNVTSALCVCERSGAVYTGDAHGAIRKWLPTKAVGSEYLSGPHKVEGRASVRIAYSEAAATAETPSVVHEVRMPNNDPSHRPPAPMDTKATPYHRTAVSDVLCINGDYLASGGSDGVIKLWK